MLEFLSVNLPTILVGAVVILVVTLASIKLIRDKINNKGCGSCSGCPSQGTCHHK